MNFSIKQPLYYVTTFECPYVNGLIRSIEKSLPLPIDCQLALIKCTTFQTLQAQEVLLEAGQISDRLYWVERD